MPRPNPTESRRTAVVIRSNAAYRSARCVQVVPISSRFGTLYPCDRLTQLQGRQCEAMADRLVAVSKSRLRAPLASLIAEELERVETIIRLQLGL